MCFRLFCKDTVWRWVMVKDIQRFIPRLARHYSVKNKYMAFFLEGTQLSFMYFPRNQSPVFYIHLNWPIQKRAAWNGFTYCLTHSRIVLYQTRHFYPFHSTHFINSSWVRNEGHTSKLEEDLWDTYSACVLQNDITLHWFMLLYQCIARFAS